MNSEASIAEVLRTSAGSESQREPRCLSALDLTGEAGEVADSAKKAVFQGHEIDAAHLARE
ncbi:MAG TPA: hypothetical protein VHZ51_17135 [Ktedonobacteraceae bacterium]|nr:hypothetical protein [Ktedonobacteraceae bacterium]